MASAKLFTIEQIIRPQGPKLGAYSPGIAQGSFSIEQIVSPKGPQAPLAAEVQADMAPAAPPATLVATRAATGMVASDTVASDALAAVEPAADEPLN